jgi:hypothetical protein
VTPGGPSVPGGMNWPTRETRGALAEVRLRCGSPNRCVAPRARGVHSNARIPKSAPEAHTAACSRRSRGPGRRGGRGKPLRSGSAWPRCSASACWSGSWPRLPSPARDPFPHRPTSGRGDVRPLAKSCTAGASNTGCSASAAQPLVSCSSWAFRKSYPDDHRRPISSSPARDASI